MGEMKGNKESKEEMYKRYDKIKIILRKVRFFLALLEARDDDLHPATLKHTSQTAPKRCVIFTF